MHLDIREILSKRIGRRLPKFISRPLEKLIHQDELNGFFATCEGATPEEFLKKAFEFLNVTHTVEYTAPLADDERYIFASNHPFGGLDGMLLVDALVERAEVEHVVEHVVRGDDAAVAGHQTADVRLAQAHIALKEGGTVVPRVPLEGQLLRDHVQRGGLAASVAAAAEQ